MKIICLLFRLHWWSGWDLDKNYRNPSRKCSWCKLIETKSLDSKFDRWWGWQSGMQFGTWDKKLGEWVKDDWAYAYHKRFFR